MTPATYYGLGRAYLAIPDAGVHLGEALDYAQRAVREMTAASLRIAADNASDGDFVLTRELAASWDTLGWIKFRTGDAAAAQRYVQASWDIAQEPNIGQHLVEIYEKLGKPEKAALICNMALAAHGSVEDHKKLESEMERLRAHLKPAGSSLRPPPDGAMALSDVRTLRIPLHVKLRDKSNSAHYDLPRAWTQAPGRDFCLGRPGAAECGGGSGAGKVSANISG